MRFFTKGFPDGRITGSIDGSRKTVLFLTINPGRSLKLAPCKHFSVHENLSARGSGFFFSKKKCVPSSLGFGKLGHDHLHLYGTACDHAVALSFCYSYQLQSLSNLTKQNNNA